MIENPTTPNRELVIPKIDACSVVMTEPQLRIGLILQDGSYVGLLSVFIFSTVSTNDASSPIAPSMMSNQGKSFSKVIFFLAMGGFLTDCFFGVAMVPLLEFF